jgi:hypothetical protein
MKTCKNYKCGDEVAEDAWVPLCASCRFLAKWMFALGAGVVGAVWEIVRRLR